MDRDALPTLNLSSTLQQASTHNEATLECGLDVQTTAVSMVGILTDTICGKKLPNETA